MGKPEGKRYYKTRMRARGQLTLPVEVRRALRVRDGDDLVFGVNDQGQIVVERAQIIPPDQAWFWSERWQRMEKVAQADVAAGRIRFHAGVDEVIAHLEGPADAADRDD